MYLQLISALSSLLSDSELRPKHTGADAQRRAFHARQKPPLAPTGSIATVALQYKIRKSPVNQPQQRHETQWVSSLL